MPSLAVFKAGLNEALRNLVQCGVPSNLLMFYDSVTLCGQGSNPLGQGTCKPLLSLTCIQNLDSFLPGKGTAYNSSTL